MRWTITSYTESHAHVPPLNGSITFHPILSETFNISFPRFADQNIRHRRFGIDGQRHGHKTPKISGDWSGERHGVIAIVNASKASPPNR